MKKTKQSVKQKNKEEISELVYDRNFILGLVVFAVTLLIIGFGAIGYVKNSRNNAVTKNAQASRSAIVETNEKIVTPIATSTPISKSPENSSASDKPKFVVKELPNTQGDTFYTVRAHDNFWKISKLMCGTGVYYLSIKQYNGYQNRTLRPGDVLTIVCDQ